MWPSHNIWNLVSLFSDFYDSNSTKIIFNFIEWVVRGTGWKGFADIQGTGQIQCQLWLRFEHTIWTWGWIQNHTPFGTRRRGWAPLRWRTFIGKIFSHDLIFVVWIFARFLLRRTAEAEVRKLKKIVKTLRVKFNSRWRH